jgi:hypothetical protein
MQCRCGPRHPTSPCGRRGQPSIIRADSAGHRPARRRARTAAGSQLRKRPSASTRASGCS